MSKHTKEAYAEVDKFIKILGAQYSEKIPPKLIKFFEEKKSKDYIVNIDPHIPIDEQNLKEETLAIIAFLNLRYWCEDEKEKERLKKVYAQNEEKHQKILSEKYNSNDLFKKNKEKKETVSKEVSLIEYKESFLKKLINKIKNIFHFK